MNFPINNKALNVQGKLLPSPEPFALAVSQKLLKTIQNAIAESNGKIDFACFMEMALYTPGFGYYSAGAYKFGRQGDYITAPELSPLFAQCLAKATRAILSEINQPSILEIGAGSGILAVELLLALKAEQALPTAYYILERSSDLKQRQQKLLNERLPEFYGCIHWLNDWPQEFAGVVLANEVLDALPVQRFYISPEGITACFISSEDGALKCGWEPASGLLLNRVQAIQAEFLSEVDNYQSEISLLIPGWLQGLATCLQQGVIILIDYGFPRREYYHPQRQQGTLMCHYQHQAHTDFLLWPGLQDITAHIDFTLVAEAAVAAGLEVLGYTSQAAFLLENGLLDFIAPENINHKQHVKLLTSPQEMGEMFKVMVLGKDFNHSVPGLLFADRRHRL
jgi:SAM-dependent MidA family methyltransferase